MKNLKFYLIAVCILFCIATFAQVQVDHPIQLTGSGANARISGIDSVSASGDAVSVKTLQNGAFIYAVATGSNNNFSISINPPVSACQAGMVFNFISNQNVIGAATLDVNNLGTVAITKYVNEPLTGCEIITGQAVTVLYDGTNFQMTSVFGNPATVANAGTNQLNVNDTSAILAANTPSGGTGLWSVVSGTGGTFSNTSSPTSSFTGTQGNTYVLKWTVTASCGASTSSNVTVSFAIRKETFTYTGSNQTFTVPSGINSVFVKLWGGGGSTRDYSGGISTSGGGGAFLNGTLSVTPGQQLILIIGGGGTCQTGPGAFGGGGTVQLPDYGGGGGRSAIQISSGTDILTAAGGGGGATTTPSNGGGHGGGGGGSPSGTGSAGLAYCGNGGGGGATTSTGGAAGIACGGGSGYNGFAGSAYMGGTGCYAGGYLGTGASGGGGYFGGGGGENYYGGGGGGGSSYYEGSGFTLTSNAAGTTISAGATGAATPGGNADPDYQSGIGVGTAANNSLNGCNTTDYGGNGLIVVSW